MYRLNNSIVTITIIFFTTVILFHEFLQSDIVIAGGESGIYINPNYLDYASTWQERYNFGFPSNGTVTNYYFVKVFFGFLEVILPNNIHPSLVILLLSHFLSSTFAYLMFKNLFKFRNKFIYLPGSIFYGFNVYWLYLGIAETITLTFIFLPIYVFLYIKWVKTKKWTYPLLLAIITIISSTIANNLSLYFVLFIPLLLYMVYELMVGNLTLKDMKVLVFQHCVFAVIVLLGNAFWLLPLYEHLIYIYDNKSMNTWSASSAGRYFDHFRVIGGWAWRLSHLGVPYYPFHKIIDNAYFVFLGYVPIFLTTLYFIFNKNKNKLAYFFLFLMAVGFLLMSGGKYWIGNIFSLLYENIAIFSMYREPFTKFGFLYLLSLSALLTVALHYFSKALITSKFNPILVLVCFSILLPLFPYYSGESIKKSFAFKVPEYWQEYNKYINENNIDNILLSPYSIYGVKHNFNTYHGSTIPLPIFLTSSKKYYMATDKIIEPNPQINNHFLNLINNNSDSFSKKIGILGIKYLLQMNDVDLNQSDKVYSPNYYKNKYINDNLLLIKDFNSGNDDSDNEATKRYDKSIKRRTDTSKNSLQLYKVQDNNVTEYFYRPNIYKADSDFISFDNIIDEFDINSGNIPVIIPENILNSIDINRKSKAGNIEYKKISATKYKVTIPSLANEQIIIMNARFDNNWSINKDEADSVNFTFNHFIANKWLNGWLIKAKQLDNSTELSDNYVFYIEYSKQGSYDKLLFISHMMLILLLLITLLLQRKNHLKDKGFSL